ncbi:MAG TPA: UvrD-helicase domain-containing protein, partial [Polyangiales bacterium]|nr:UvrD-helicase domain-containing protein [Polyangiales bacterium]
MERIVGEEQRVLSRVLKHLAGRPLRKLGRIDYDSELVSLRDQIAEARLEDVPALVAQMERLQQVAARRADIVDEHVDVGSPYFGRIVLQEGDRKREVLIGRSTYLDPRTGVQIVDWRDAPVSRVYYRYDEGDDYDEQFGGRMVEGEVLTRRSVAITSSKLRRVASIQGTFLNRREDLWIRLGDGAQLKGGQGSAPRPSHYKPVGKLGVQHEAALREDKRLPEIAALIDSRQFELITKPDSGLVVIQGGAGSGKTTIGLHRLAYLAYRDKQRFRPERMLVVVFNDALARYISFVLPALGVNGVAVTT